MVINGHLKFHTIGDGEIQNAIIERLAGGVAGASLPADGGLTGNGAGAAGRIAYNTDDNVYYYWSGTAWSPFATGGDAAGLQQEVDNIELTIGDMIDTDGTAVVAVMRGLTNVDNTANTITDVLQQLDQAIEGKDTLAELDDVNAGDDWSLATGDFLRYDGTTWEDHVLVTADLTDTTVTNTELNYLAGVTSDVQTQISNNDTDITNLQTADDNMQTFMGSAGDTDTDPAYSSATQVTQGASLTTAIGELDAALNTALTGIPLGDLSDVTDGLTGTLVTSGAQQNAEGDTYMFRATAVDAYEVEAATLGALNNVAYGVDTATDEDVLGFDGSAWTAVTPATLGAEINFTDLKDTPASYTATYMVRVNAAGDGLEFVAAGSTSGFQAHDAFLDELSLAEGPGIMVRNGDDVLYRSIDIEGAGVDADASSRLVVGNANGVSGNPTLDLAEIPDAGTGTSFLKLVRDAYGRITATEAVIASDITGLVDSTYVNITGDTMTGSLVIPAGEVVTVTDAPTNATDAVNKQYVDNLVSAGTSWIQPIENPDFVGVAQAEPTSPLISGAYIAYGGVGYPQTWTGGVSVAEGDYMHWTFGAWEKSRNPLTAGDNLLVGVWTDAVDNTAGQDIPSFLYIDDYVRYQGGDPDTAAAWDFPYGRSGSHPGWSATGDNVDTITITGSDETASLKAGNEATFDGNTFTIVSVTFTGGNTEVVVSGNPGSATATLAAELRDGGTTSVLNDSDGHNGDTYLYSGDDNEWVAISGPGSVGAGTGLAYSGSTLNVVLGAGIKELPSDEVGIDIYTGPNALILTQDGSTASTDTAAMLALKLNGSTLTQTTADGLNVANGGITGTELNSSVAGAGLSGGGGSALSVNVDDATIEINVDTLQVKDDGITNDKILNDHYTLATNGTGADQDVHFGDTLNVNQGEAILVDITAADTILISAELASDTNPGVATFNTANFDVSAGGDVTIKSGGVNLDEIAADANHIGVTADDDSSDVALGSNISILGSTESGSQFGVATANTSGSVAITVTGGVNQLDDVTEAAPASGDLLVRDGTDYKNVHISHVHTQSTSATSWTVTHSIGQKFVNVTVYDSTDNVIIPQSIVATDANTTTITFNTAIGGTAVVMGVPGSPTSSA